MEVPLIEFVSQNRFLFDKEHKYFKNNRMRHKKFQELEKRLNIPVQKLKDRWRTLRDKYNKELKFGPTPQVRKWKWMDQLSFLTDVDVGSSLSSSTYVKEDPLDLSETEENSECDRSTLVKVSSSRSAGHKGIKRKLNDLSKQPAKDQFHKKCRKANEIILPPCEEQKASVDMFFSGLAMQAREAQLTPLEFTSLQIAFLETFKSFLNKKEETNAQQSWNSSTSHNK